MILDPIGAIVYYANQIYVNRGLFETMSVGLLKHAIFTNHSLQKHKILVLCYFRDNSYNCDYIKQGPTVLYQKFVELIKPDCLNVRHISSVSRLFNLQ